MALANTCCSSETTGTAIFDHSATSAKTGIASRAMRPLLGIVDPLNTETCPTAVHVSSGLDVLFHALEVCGVQGCCQVRH